VRRQDPKLFLVQFLGTMWPKNGWLNWEFQELDFTCQNSLTRYWQESIQKS